MPFAYDRAPAQGSLRQGEILADVTFHRPLLSAAPVPEGAGYEIAQITRPFVVVMHNDCDLDQDFNARQAADAAGTSVSETDRDILPYVLLCDAYVEPEIRARPGISGVWSSVVKAQHERFQMLKPAPVDGMDDTTLPPLVLDFRKLFAISPPSLYAAIGAGAIRRYAVVPAVYMQDLMHRFYSYQSRVALPTDEVPKHV